MKKNRHCSKQMKLLKRSKSSIKKIAAILTVITLTLSLCPQLVNAESANTLSEENDNLEVTYTKPGLYSPDGSTPYIPHSPNPVTGRTLNVQSFGAIPNSGIDNKAAIQAAINAAKPGDEVFIPDGVYHLKADSSAVTMLTLKSGVNLRGESKEGTVLLAYFERTSIRNSVMRVLGKEDIVISNMTIKGDVPDPSYVLDHNSNTVKTNEPTYLIHIEDSKAVPSKFIDIEDLVLEKCKEMAIRVSKSHDVSIRRITVRNLTDVGGGGTGYGVSIQGAGHKNDRLGYENDTYYNIVEDSNFEGPYIRHGVLLQYYAHNNLVKDNSFYQTVLDAIDLHGEDEYLNDIDSNYIENVLKNGAIGVGNSGATHRNAGPYNYLHDNVFTNCRDGIRVYLGTEDTLIENNRIINTTQPDNAVGIWVQNAPGTIVRGNVIEGNKAKGFWGIKLEYDNGDPVNGGEGIPENILIENNQVSDNANGVWIKDGNFITLRDNEIQNNIGIDLIDNSTNYSEFNTLLPTDDTYVEYSSTYPDRNANGFGSGATSNHKQLKVKNTSSIKRVTLMRFDLSDYDLNSRTVLLDLATKFGTIDPDKNSPGNMDVTVYGLPIIDWSEGNAAKSLSWNDAIEKGFFTDKIATGDNLRISNEATSLGVLEITSEIKDYILDITEYAQEESIFTLVFIAEYGNGANLNILSKENTKEEDRSRILIVKE